MMPGEQGQLDVDATQVIDALGQKIGSLEVENATLRAGISSLRETIQTQAGLLADQGKEEPSV